MTGVKAILMGVVVSWIFSAILGAQGTDWGSLYIHLVQWEIHQGGFETVRYFWSWPIFFASTGISWGIIAMMS